MNKRYAQLKIHFPDGGDDDIAVLQRASIDLVQSAGGDDDDGDDDINDSCNYVGTLKNQSGA